MSKPFKPVPFERDWEVCQTGNRCPVPSPLPGPHFAYKCAVKAPVEENRSDYDLVAQTVLDQIGDQNMQAGVIQIGLNRNKSKRSIRVSLENIARSAGLLKIAREDDLDVLYCQQALPHCDPNYAGKSFASVVIHTGPHPYVFQTFNQQLLRDASLNSRMEINLSVLSISLEVGDVLIFDPTTPHMAVPKFPHQDSFLIMAQVEISDATADERQIIIKIFPPEIEVAHE